MGVAGITDDGSRHGLFSTNGVYYDDDCVDFDGFLMTIVEGCFHKQEPINGWRTSHRNTAIVIIHIAQP